MVLLEHLELLLQMLLGLLKPHVVLIVVLHPRVVLLLLVLLQLLLLHLLLLHLWLQLRLLLLWHGAIGKTLRHATRGKTHSCALEAGLLLLTSTTSPRTLLLRKLCLTHHRIEALLHAASHLHATGHHALHVLHLHASHTLHRRHAAWLHPTHALHSLHSWLLGVSTKGSPIRSTRTTHATLAAALLPLHSSARHEARAAGHARTWAGCRHLTCRCVGHTTHGLRLGWGRC
mmetsp:Transcript_58686/g.139834  ORF Transcript_58686/g.139834 Transcript_58686/m.139834 type:complete len:231 (-) Transcript_58686:302-994(-)